MVVLLENVDGVSIALAMTVCVQTVVTC